jgi:hypothetical protein
MNECCKKSQLNLLDHIISVMNENKEDKELTLEHFIKSIELCRLVMNEV